MLCCDIAATGGGLIRWLRAARGRSPARAPGRPGWLSEMLLLGIALQAGPERPRLLRDIQLGVGDNALSGSACSPAPGQSAHLRDQTSPA